MGFLQPGLWIKHRHMYNPNLQMLCQHEIRLCVSLAFSVIWTESMWAVVCTTYLFYFPYFLEQGACTLSAADMHKQWIYPNRWHFTPDMLSLCFWSSWVTAALKWWLMSFSARFQAEQCHSPCCSRPVGVMTGAASSTITQDYRTGLAWCKN